MVTLSNDGFIKRIPLKSYNRSNANVEEIEYREGDYNKQVFLSNTKDTLMFFTDKGNMFQIKGIGVPELKWKEKGERIDSLIKGLDLTKEKVIIAYSISTFVVPKDFVFLTNKGGFKKTSIDKFDTSYTKIQALKLKAEEKVIDVTLLDKEREEGFIMVKTKNGLEFSLEEPKLESADRNILGIELFKLSSDNEIIDFHYTKEYEFKTFGVSINNNGIIKVHHTGKSPANSPLFVQTDSTSKLILFSEDGMAYSVPAFMIENINEVGMKIKDLLEELKSSNKKIIKIMTVKEFSESIDLFFFSRKGMIKKTLLSELTGEYSSTLVYKLKGDNDGLVNVVHCYNNDKEKDKDIVLVTKKAMCIRFENSSINLMGKVASGVTGISLKEDDEVIFGALIGSEHCDVNENDELAISKVAKGEITLLSSTKNKKLVPLNDIKIQNRAGRGSNVMPVAIDEYIITVKLN
jgi:DNA gyrase/topoisomerase IV subunit A